MAPLKSLIVLLFSYTLLASADHSFKASNHRRVARAVSTSNPTLSSVPNETISASTSKPSSTASIPLGPLKDAKPPSTSASASEDVQRVIKRRLSNIIGSLTDVGPDDLNAWLKSLGTNGQWPSSEVNYATGCKAERANWPAEEHWKRLLRMAAAWRGGIKGTDQFVNSQALHDAIGKGMDFWFSRDITNPACFDQGGKDACPCDDNDNTFWNTNWFGNVILIPNLMSQACVVLNDTLSASQMQGCTKITGRSYNSFVTGIASVSSITGANALDIAKIGIDLGLLTLNETLVTEAYGRIHHELVIQQAVHADGIRPDGSFGQHTGLLYNGNYGKDFTNDILDLEIEAGGTQFQADSAGQSALKTLFEGDKWMIIYNTVTSTLHWDLSVLSRFISFPVADQQATGGLNINLTKIEVLGREWGAPDLGSLVGSLQGSKGVNAGNLQGNRMFYTNDYMVHRGNNYVTTLKMYSNRTQNSECTNSQNPLGFHLADGTLYTYLKGNEYEDIAAAWDFNLIPGITTDYGATPLTCDKIRFKGLQSFVGGVSDGQTGIAVMSYTNPATKAFSFQKAWFFLGDDAQHVMISNIASTSSTPVFTVLDQKRRSGNVYVGGLKGALNTEAQDEIRLTVAIPDVEGLWHDNVGYIVQTPGVTISVQTGVKTGSWKSIGTSSSPDAKVDLFSAWLTHDPSALNAPVAYTAYPGTGFEDFRAKALKPSFMSLQNDASVSAVFDLKRSILMAVFWNAAGGSIELKQGDFSCSLSSNTAATVMYDLKSRALTVSDPSQTASSVGITVTLNGAKSQTANINLPKDGQAGSSVTQTL